MLPISQLSFYLPPRALLLKLFSLKKMEDVSWLWIQPGKARLRSILVTLRKEFQSTHPRIIDHSFKL